MWKISLSKQTDKFTKNKKIGDDEILSFINKFINYSKGSDEISTSDGLNQSIVK